MNAHIKKSLLPIGFLFIILVFSSCNNGSGHSDEDHHDHDTHDHTTQVQDPISHGEGSHGHDEMIDETLKLNNGEKWQADEPTNKNADRIISIGEQFLESGDKSLADYKRFGEDVNEAINIMIRECTMEGEADHALHIWFLPLIRQASTLREASDTTGLEEITMEMVDRMKMYHGYFE